LNNRLLHALFSDAAAWREFTPEPLSAEAA
jgi:hypothetical protein